MDEAEVSTFSQEMTLGEVGRAVNRIEHKLDDLMADHEKRIRQLERWMWGTVALGGAGVASGVGAMIQSGVFG